MSLINDALKKAQKMRTQNPVSSAPFLPDDGPGPVAKRSRPMSARWLLGIVAGATVLVAGSVLATVFLLHKPQAAPVPQPAVLPTTVAESPVLSPAAPPTGKSETPSAPVLTVTAPAPASVPPSPAAPAPANVPPPPAAPISAPPTAEANTPPVASPEIRPAAPPPPASAGKFDARAQAYVDALHVTGIRASGDDSKVLMNDRVFRLNDIVERSLGLRLTGVAAERLSFTDANGVVYTRNF